MQEAPNVDNLRVFLHVARNGRLGDAALRLGVDETTVSRRITRLETELGCRLFDRTPQGWRLTEPGRGVLPHAEAIEASATRALEAVSSPHGTISGIARILAPDGFGAYILLPGLKPLRDAHPNLDIELLTATTHDHLTTRDFDIAITLERPSARYARVHHLADYELRFYASAGYLEANGAPSSVEDLRAHHPLIWYVDALLDVQPLRFLGDLVPRARARVQTNNITGHYAAARAGLGIVPLPTYIGAADPTLNEVLPEVLRARRAYWLVIPRDLTPMLRVQELARTIRRIVADHPHLTLAAGAEEP